MQKNGIIDPGMLYESPFTDINDQGLDGVFDNGERKAIVRIIRAVNNNAEAV